MAYWVLAVVTVSASYIPGTVLSSLHYQLIQCSQQPSDAGIIMICIV